MAGRFELKQSSNELYFFTLKSANGQVLLTSDMYSKRRNAENGIESVRKNAANEKRFEKVETTSRQYYFNLKAGNGVLLGASQRYNTAQAMNNGIKAVQKNAPDAPVKDTTGRISII